MFPFKLTYNCLNNEARHLYDEREDKIKRTVIWSLCLVLCPSLGRLGAGWLLKHLALFKWG